MDSLQALPRRGAAVLAAVVLTLTLGVASAFAAGGATIETVTLDSSHSHEEPTGEVTYFDLTGAVRIVTTPDGRQSATIQYVDRQTTVLGDQVLIESVSSGKQTMLSKGDDIFVVHLTSRSSWTSGGEEFSSRFLIQIVNGVVVAEVTG